MMARPWPSAASIDGAHSSATPVVPWASVTTCRPPSGAGPAGTPAMPVTAMGSPATSSDRYITLYSVAPPASAPSTGW